jgi:hypothetical protein
MKIPEMWTKRAGDRDPEMARRTLFGKPWKCCGGGGGGNTKVLLTLCELLIKQSNKVNKLEREHNMQPQLPSLVAGTYLANKETRLGPAPENG